jgi:hypothetical protein
MRMASPARSADLPLEYSRVADSAPSDQAEEVSGSDISCMFAFFSNKLGCLGSIVISVIGTAILLVVMRGCA